MQWCSIENSTKTWLDRWKVKASTKWLLKVERRRDDLEVGVAASAGWAWASARSIYRFNISSYFLSYWFHPPSHQNQDYSEAATIHGISYIGERGQVEGMIMIMTATTMTMRRAMLVTMMVQVFSHRLFWVFIVFGGVAFAVFLSTSAYLDWQVKVFVFVLIIGVFVFLPTSTYLNWQVQACLKETGNNISLCMTNLSMVSIYHMVTRLVHKIYINSTFPLKMNSKVCFW